MKLEKQTERQTKIIVSILALLFWLFFTRTGLLHCPAKMNEREEKEETNFITRKWIGAS